MLARTIDALLRISRLLRPWQDYWIWAWWGPGRDLRTFKAMGHVRGGAGDGCGKLVEMGQGRTALRSLAHGIFLAWICRPSAFGWHFRNATCFHIPSKKLPWRFTAVASSLKPVACCSAPNRGGGRIRKAGPVMYAPIYRLERGGHLEQRVCRD